MQYNFEEGYQNDGMLLEKEEYSVKKISRKEIIKLFPEYEFIKGSNVDGKEHYYFQSNIFLIQLVGKKTSLEEIVVTHAFNSQAEGLADAKGQKSEYLGRIIDRLMPSLEKQPSAYLSKDGDTIDADGFRLIYSKSRISGRDTMVSYTFQPIKYFKVSPKEYPFN